MLDTKTSRASRRAALVIALCVLVCALLCGCSFSGGEREKPLIVTTVFPAYDFARSVFGDTAEVVLLLKPGTESHSYDPSARDVTKISSCDMFIYNGGESDAWVDTVLEAVEGDMRAVRMMDFVEALEEEVSDEMTAEHEDGDEVEYDEHVWTSPKNAVLIIEGIAGAAAELLPENADVYARNSAEYIDKINELDKRFAELFKGEKRAFVFGDRFPLMYFFEEYGLRHYAAFPGCGAETEPSARTVSILIEKLRSEDTVDAVFCIELSNRRTAEALAEETGLPVLMFHSCHNITADDFEAGETYLSLMQRNYECLKGLSEG